MNIQERYIEQIKYSLRGLGEVQEVTKNNMKAYTFPCVFWSQSQQKDRNKRKRTAILFTRQKELPDYVFHCCRCKEKMDFSTFLWRHKPMIAEKYKRDRGEIEGFDFKPNINH